jgi:hypothetical protein
MILLPNIYLEKKYERKLVKKISSTRESTEGFYNFLEKVQESPYRVILSLAFGFSLCWENCKVQPSISLIFSSNDKTSLLPVTEFLFLTLNIFD